MNLSVRQKGFTLIELLVVIAIIGILAAVGIPWYQGYTIQAKEKQAINNLQSIQLAQIEYYKDRDNYYCFHFLQLYDESVPVNTPNCIVQRIKQIGYTLEGIYNRINEIQKKIDENYFV